jgi:heat shock protein HslJ
MFSGNQASGTTGCNRYAVEHQRQNGKSRFIEGTVMTGACVNTAQNELASRYMTALVQMTSLDLSATRLVMRSDNGQITMVFEPD